VSRGCTDTLRCSRPFLAYRDLRSGGLAGAKSDAVRRRYARLGYWHEPLIARLVRTIGWTVLNIAVPCSTYATAPLPIWEGGAVLDTVMATKGLFSFCEEPCSASRAQEVPSDVTL
jgi:hypothetical protein